MMHWKSIYKKILSPFPRPINESQDEFVERTNGRNIEELSPRSPHFKDDIYDLRSSFSGLVSPNLQLKQLKNKARVIRAHTTTSKLFKESKSVEKWRSSSVERESSSLSSLHSFYIKYLKREFRRVKNQIHLQRRSMGNVHTSNNFLKVSKKLHFITHFRSNSKSSTKKFEPEEIDLPMILSMRRNSLRLPSQKKPNDRFHFLAFHELQAIAGNLFELNSLKRNAAKFFTFEDNNETSEYAKISKTIPFSVTSSRAIASTENIEISDEKRIELYLNTKKFNSNKLGIFCESAINRSTNNLSVSNKRDIFAKRPSVLLPQLDEQKLAFGRRLSHFVDSKAKNTRTLKSTNDSHISELLIKNKKSQFKSVPLNGTKRTSVEKANNLKIATKYNMKLKFMLCKNFSETERNQSFKNKKNISKSIYYK